MNISVPDLFDLFEKVKARFMSPKRSNSPPPLPAPLDKPESDKLSKTVLPNAVRTIAPDATGSPSPAGNRSHMVAMGAPAKRPHDLPPAVALAKQAGATDPSHRLTGFRHPTHRDQAVKPVSMERAVRRPATISAVAVRAGVSESTVSRVLKGGALVREVTRQRVQMALAELGYRPSFLPLDRGGRPADVARSVPCG